MWSKWALFTFQHIFAFLEYGDKICSTELENKYKADKIIIRGIENLHDENTIKSLIEKGADGHARYDLALIWSSKSGKTVIRKGRVLVKETLIHFSIAYVKFFSYLVEHEGNYFIYSVFVSIFSREK